jgi:hypothetical protein
LIRWTTSAQSSRLNAVAVFVTEYWTYTVGETGRQVAAHADDRMLGLVAGRLRLEGVVRVLVR